MTTQSVEAAIIISAREQASKALVQVAKALSEIGSKASEASTSASQSFTGGLVPALDEAWQKIDSLLEPVQSFNTSISQMTATFQGKLNELFEPVNTFNESVTTMRDSVMEKFNTLLEPVTVFRDTVSEMKETVSEKFTELQEPLRAFNDLVSQGKDAINEGKMAFDTAKGAIDLAKESYGQIKESIGAFKQTLETVLPVIRLTGITMRTALIASGIGLVIAILGVLFLAWQNDWGGIQEKVKAVVEFIRELIGKFVGFIKDHWKEIATILTLFIGGPLAAFAVAWSTNAFGIRDKLTEIWDKIKSFLSETWNSIKETALKIFDTIKNSIEDVWNRIKEITSNIWNSITDAIKGAINNIIGFINTLIRAWNNLKLKVPEVTIGVGPLKQTFGGFELGLPEIPEIPLLAQGGVVSRPTLAMLGESGPEAVVPLRRMGRGFEAGNALRHMQPIVVNVFVDGRIVKSMAVEGVREAFVNAGLGPGAFAPGL